MSNRSWNIQKNIACRVCGADSEDKVCAKCVSKYSELFDLHTPDGRYAARVAEQGTSEDRWQREQERREELDERRKPLIKRIQEKLTDADIALQENRFADLAATLKGIELLSKKLKAII